MASVCTEGQLLRPSESPQMKHKRRRRDDMELTFPSPRRAVAAIPSVQAWLHSLSAAERQQVLMVENCWATSILRQMLGRKLREGETVFTPLAKNSRYESSKLEDYYVFSRPSHEAANADVEFEQNLRLCDSAQYLDTITVASDLASDCGRFLHLANIVSAGEIFRSPCRVFWDTSSKSWTWECPAWTAGKILTQSQFVLALFEKTCWQSFFAACKLDPRAPGETQPYSPEPCAARVSDLPSLVAFWKSASKERRTALAGDPATLAAEFSAQKQQHQEMQRKSCDLLHTFCSSASFLTLYANSSPYYSALRGKMQHYMSPSSTEILRVNSADMSAGEFLDFLVKSPLERAGTVFDLVARSVAVAVREGLKSQIADDLLQSEKKSPTAEAARKRKSHKKTRRDSSNASTACSPNARVCPALEDDSAHEVALFIIELILRQVACNMSEDDFQTVQAGRKKAKKPNLHVATSRARKSKPKVKSAQPATAMRSAPVSPAVIKWASDRPTPSASFQPSVDFPPLSSSPVFNFDALNNEMAQYSCRLQEEMTRRSRVMGFLVNKLQEVMACLFPGAFLATFGSYATGLALPSSDLDVALVNAGMDVEDIAQAVSMLEEVLPAYRWVESIKGITTATVPVVKLMVNPQYFSRETQELIQVDITFEDEACESHHLGLATCAWVRDFLQRYPQATACFLVLKQLLLTYQLNSTYHGGLSSYSLVLWLHAYLQGHAQDRGELLTGFLKFYGSEFNSKSVGIDASGENCYFPRQQPVFTLCETIDPLRSDNNTTKGAFRIAEVQELFRRAHEFLTATVAHGQPRALSRLLAKSDLIKV